MRFFLLSSYFSIQLQKFFRGWNGKFIVSVCDCVGWENWIKQRKSPSSTYKFLIVVFYSDKTNSLCYIFFSTVWQQSIETNEKKKQNIEYHHPKSLYETYTNTPTVLSSAIKRIIFKHHTTRLMWITNLWNQTKGLMSFQLLSSIIHNIIIKQKKKHTQYSLNAE